jgi:hypothetical protein
LEAAEEAADQVLEAAETEEPQEPAVEEEASPTEEDTEPVDTAAEKETLVEAAESEEAAAAEQEPLVQAAESEEAEDQVLETEESPETVVGALQSTRKETTSAQDLTNTEEEEADTVKDVMGDKEEEAAMEKPREPAAEAADSKPMADSGGDESEEEELVCDQIAEILAEGRLNRERLRENDRKRNIEEKDDEEIRRLDRARKKKKKVDRCTHKGGEWEELFQFEGYTTLLRLGGCCEENCPNSGQETPTKKNPFYYCRLCWSWHRCRQCHHRVVMMAGGRGQRVRKEKKVDN